MRESEGGWLVNWSSPEIPVGNGEYVFVVFDCNGYGSDTLTYDVVVEPR